MEEGYASAPEALTIAEKLVLGFKIFAEQVNGIKGSTVKEPIVEELVLTLELEEDIPVAELKAIDDQEEELYFESYVLNSIMDVL